MDADAFHTRIDLQVDFGLHPQSCRGSLDLLQLLYRRGRHGQIVLQKQRGLVAPDAAHDQHRRGNA